MRVGIEGGRGLGVLGVAMRGIVVVTGGGDSSSGKRWWWR